MSVHLLCFLIAIVATSCAADRNASISVQATSVRHDGVTIFKGMFFGDGPVAKHFPEVWNSARVKRIKSNLDARELAAYNKAKSEVINSIGKRDPSFFRNFGRAMQSGSQVQVAK